MYELLGLIGNFIVVIGLLLLTLQAIRSIVPGPYRHTERWVKTLMRYAWLNQARKRGWLFASLVHFPLVFSLVLLVLGVVTATGQAVLAGFALVILAILAKRGLAYLKRLSRRRSLPGWRR